ncbi:MAG: hypothetical protein IJN50_06825 [Clostridia bacterium]|nr:hypothetical protein [Clostridia bacterium]
MVEDQYANAYKEVLEILKYIQIEDYNKIPKTKIELFETYSNKDYIFKYNPRKTLNEQNVSKTAKAIIGLLFRDYWATETQKDKIIEKQKYDRQQVELKKRKKYNPDNIFRNKKQNTKREKNINNTVALITYKESIYKKILNKIKSMLYK